MRRSWKRFLTIILLALSSLFVLAGCKIGKDSLDEILDKNELEAVVTYYANGGEFENTLDVKNLYYKAGVQPLDIREQGVTANIYVENYGFVFEGCYPAETNGNGEVVFEEGSDCPKASSTPADFTQYLQKGDHWTLVAVWQVEACVKVQVAGRDFSGDETLTIDGKSYGVGDVVKEYNFSNDKVNKPRRLNDFETDDKAYTFVEFYSDSACTQVCEWPIVREDGDVIVYARYIEGNWKVVKDAAGVSTMFGTGVSANDKYLIINDIDCSSTSVAAMSVKNFAGTVQGDGKSFKISGLKVTYDINNQATSTASLFGKIQSTAVIKDVAFDNIQITYKTAYLTTEMEVLVYLLYTSLSAGATVDNVKITGTLSVEYKGKASELTNITPDGNGGYTGWFAGETEVGAETAKAGFDASGVTITVTGYQKN